MPRGKAERYLELRAGDEVINKIKLERVSSVTPLASGREFMYIEKVAGSWKLTYTEQTIPDISKLTHIAMVRVN